MLPKVFGDCDYAMWVGRSFYPTREDYIREAREMGCCKKIPHIPDNVEIGKTKIFLVHKENRDKPVVFGWFVLDGIIACSKLQQVIEETKQSLMGKREYPVTAIGSEARASIPERGCGGLDPPSYYFVGPADITFVKGLRNAGPATLALPPEPKIELVQPPVPCRFLSTFRGLKRADELWLEE